MFTLENNQLKITVEQVGAQLTGLYSKVTDTQYLWQPGYETWPHSSMLLFPNPGRIARGRTIIGGKVYPANMHGFANDLPFTLAEQAPEKLILELRDNETTKKYYPYSFCLQVEFVLKDDLLIQNFTVINEGNEPLYYCLGAHPGFYCPLDLADQAEDYLRHALYREYGERQDVEDCKKDRGEHQIRTELAPACVSLVGDNTHHRVVDRVPDTCDQQDRRDCGCRQSDNVCVEDRQVRIDHVP